MHVMHDNRLGSTKSISLVGVRSGYQFRKIRVWKSKGVTVKVSNKDISTMEDTLELITEAKKLGPVGGVFNLAMVGKDLDFACAGFCF